MSRGFDLEMEFTSLLHEHRLFRYDKFNILQMGRERCSLCDLKDSCAASGADAVINKFLDKIPPDAAVAIRGAGKHTENLLKIIDDKNRSKIKYIADIEASNSQLGGLPVISAEELKRIKADYVIISSFKYRGEIKEELLKSGYDENVILDVYEYQESDSPFYSESANCHFNKTDVTWPYAIKMQNNFEAASRAKLQPQTQDYLYHSILCCLSIRDIVNAKKYMQTYIDSRYRDFEMFEGFIAGLDKMLIKAKQAISDKCNENIIMMLIDAFDNQFVDFMSNLKSIREECIVFNYPIVQYPWTTSALQTIFTGMDIIDEKAYAIDSFNYENSRLLNVIKENGYDFYALNKLRRTLFTEVSNYENNNADIMPKTLWELLKLLLASNKKGFYYLHFYEVHAPYLCGFSSDFCDFNTFFVNKAGGFVSDDDLATAQLCALKYADEQLAFYNEFIPEDNIRIFMGDHSNFPMILDGTHVNETKIYGLHKPALFIKSSRHERKTYDELFGLINFSDLIQYLAGAADDSSLFQDYVKIQILPVYNEKGFHKILKYKWELNLPKKGILTKNERYLIDYKGEEEYYILEGGEYYKNRIDNPEFQERIDELRALCDSDFHNIFEHPKFEYAKMVYSKLGII